MNADRKLRLREVMNLAWSLVKRNGFSMAEALKTAWANFKFKALAKKKVVEFYYRKVDGTLRQAFGTLKDTIVPPTQGTRRQYAGTQCYFDTEKGEWRCFKVCNLITVIDK